MTRTSEPRHLIAVLGVTGAGKTTFISRATGRPDLAIGHGLNSCTSDISSYDIKLNGKSITLIDTPGFDDTYRSDTDILRMLANWLMERYSKGTLLTGVILLQPVNTNRVQGSEQKRTRLFELICGPNAFSQVVIATTMWSEVCCHKQAAQRMQERAVSNDFWGKMVTHGAQVERHDDNQDSALRIGSMLCEDHKPMELLLQKEIAENGGALLNTSAGHQLNANLGEGITNLQAEIEEIQQEQRETMEQNKQLSEELEALRREVENKQQEKEDLATEQPWRCTIL